MVKAVLANSSTNYTLTIFSLVTANQILHPGYYGIDTSAITIFT